jgi:hypothetical protein
MYHHQCSGVYSSVLSKVQGLLSPAPLPSRAVPIKLHRENNRAMVAFQIHRWQIYALAQNEIARGEGAFEVPQASAQDDRARRDTNQILI